MLQKGLEQMRFYMSRFGRVDCLLLTAYCLLLTGPVISKNNSVTNEALPLSIILDTGPRLRRAKHRTPDTA